MSYNVAICLPPVPVEDGVAWTDIDRLADCEGDAAPEFVDLHAALTARYPCICGLSDADVDGGVWSDGPLLNNFGARAAVIGIVYSRVDEVLPFVVEAATSRGMVVFDWATQQVHRPRDRTQPRKPPPQARKLWWRFW
jgi:hypothetical protein